MKTLMDVICNKCKSKFSGNIVDVTIENMGEWIHHKDYCEECERLLKGEWKMEELYQGSNVICRFCGKEVSAFSIFRHEKECDENGVWYGIDIWKENHSSLF